MKDCEFSYLYEKLGYEKNTKSKYSVLQKATKEWFVQWQNSGRTILPSDVNKMAEAVACAEGFLKEKGGLF
jgi:hypothetical protein